MIVIKGVVLYFLFVEKKNLIFFKYDVEGNLYI